MQDTRSIEEIYVFRLTAHIFLIEDTDYDYSGTDVSAYIKYNNVAEALAAEIATPFETPLNKCLQSTSYNADTGLMTAIFEVLVNENTSEFTNSMDEAETFKYLILDMSFEDGIYEGERATFTVNGEHVGFFDIRNSSGLHVDFIGKKPGPSQVDYEALWRKEHDKERSKISAAEVIMDWHSYSASVGNERRQIQHTLYTKYAIRHIYGVTGMFIELLKKPFYKTAEERLSALLRIVV